MDERVTRRGTSRGKKVTSTNLHNRCDGETRLKEFEKEFSVQLRTS